MPQFTDHNLLVFINQMRNSNQTYALGALFAVLQRGGQAYQGERKCPGRRVVDFLFFLYVTNLRCPSVIHNLRVGVLRVANIGIARVCSLSHSLAHLPLQVDTPECD